MIFKQWFRSFQIDNEENALVCLRIIIELNKQFRPVFTSEVSIRALTFYFFIYTLFFYCPCNNNNPDSNNNQVFCLFQCVAATVQCFDLITF